jgi:hypothetical protein
MILIIREMIEDKTSIRPTIKNIGTIENKNPEEKFQNISLRPIIKLQHDLLIAFFQNYLKRNKIDFSQLSTLRKKELISKVFKNDSLFKTELRGLIIGHFTQEEYTTYLNMAADSNKRIMAMIEERLQSVTL